MTDADAYDDAGFVVSSDYRTRVLTRLAHGPATPSTLASDCEIDIAHVSRALGEFRERGLAELKVPEERKKGRIYGITDDGRACIRALKTLEVEV